MKSAYVERLNSFSAPRVHSIEEQEKREIWKEAVMQRITIWNDNNNGKKPCRFCDAVVINGQILLEIKYGRNNFQQMSCEEIQKQIREGIKEESKHK